MERKAYVVTVGEYSDYRIGGVFLDEAAAKEYVDNYNKVSGGGYSDQAKVEEYTEDGPVPGIVPVLRYEGRIGRGFVGDEFAEETEGFVWEDEARPLIDAYTSDTRKYGGGIFIFVKGTDFEQVRKEFRDRWAQAKAEGL